MVLTKFSLPSGKPEGYFHTILKGNLPFQTYHIDHYGPLEKTGKGYKYIFAIVDAFTKFIRLYPCKSATTAESIKCLKDYFQCYSKPRRIISDRGTALTSGDFRKFLKSEFVSHIFIVVGIPRANGQIERLNRYLTPLLAKLCDTQKKWDQAIVTVEYALNNTMSRSTGETPSRLLFSVDQFGQLNDNLRLFLDNYTENDRDLPASRHRAAENITKTQAENKKAYDSSRKKATIYREGDYVMIKNTDTTVGVNKKLISKYKGPYIIRKALDTDRYVIQDVPGFQITQLPYNGIVASDQMKYWIHEPIDE